MKGWAIAFWFVALAVVAYLLARGGTFLKHPKAVMLWGILGFIALAFFATHQLLLGVSASNQHDRGYIGQAVLVYAFSLFFLGGTIAAARVIRRNPPHGDGTDQ